MVYSVASLMSKKLDFIHGYGVTNVDPLEHFVFAKASLLGAHSRGLGSPQGPSRSDIRAEKQPKNNQGHRHHAGPNDAGASACPGLSIS